MAMQWTDITSSIVGGGAWQSNGDTVAVTMPPTGYIFGFINSGGTLFGTSNAFASNNLNKHSTTAGALFTAIPGTGPLYLKFNYISNGESNYDYAMFGQSGVTVSSGTAASSPTTAVVWTTYGKSSTAISSYTYCITGITQFNVLYRKDGSTHQGYDRLFFTVEAGKDVVASSYWYAATRVKYYGYKATSASPYAISITGTSQYNWFRIDAGNLFNGADVIQYSGVIKAKNGAPSGASCYCYWASGGSINSNGPFGGSTGIAYGYNNGYYIRSGFTKQQANRQMGTTTALTNMQYWYVLTGTTAASVRKDYTILSGTATEIKKASRECYLQEPDYKVFVGYTSSQPKGHFIINHCFFNK